MDFGLTVSEKKQLLSLLDKIQTNHCKNYQRSRFGRNCSRKTDNEVCHIEDEVYSETEFQDCDGCFYCPVFLIHNVMDA